MQADSLYQLSHTVGTCDVSIKVLIPKTDPKSAQEFMDPSPSCNIPATAECINEKVKNSESISLKNSESEECEVSHTSEITSDSRKRVRVNKDEHEHEHENENRPNNRTLGVKQIWVHIDYRRDNVARFLVDIARKNYFFGTVVMRNHVAYSQPTSDGLKFSLAYSQSETIWAYA